MLAKGLKICNILIYLFYIYLFCWQMFYFNQEIFYTRELREAYSSFFRYVPSIVLLLYGLLLFNNVTLGRKRILILDSFFAASLLYMYSTTHLLIIATLLVVFGLVIVVLRIKEIGER